MIDYKTMIEGREATESESKILKDVNDLLQQAENLLSKINLTIDGASPKPRPRG